MDKREIPPIHPGEIIREEFMIPFKLTAEQLADELDVTPECVCNLIAERTSITGELALRLSQYFGCSARFFMNLQASYELAIAEDAVGDVIRASVPRRPDLRPANNDPDHYDKHMVPGPIRHLVTKTSRPAKAKRKNKA